MHSTSTSSEGKRVLIFYHEFTAKWLGGAEYLPLLFIAELQQRGCAVTLALNRKTDFMEEAAKLYQIDIDVSNIRILEIRPENRLIYRINTRYLPFYRTWHLKKAARHADACISASNMNYFGKPAHHIVISLEAFQDKAFEDFYLHKKPLSGLPRFKRFVRRVVAESFLRPLLGMRSTRRILADPREHIYVQSRYVADMVRAFYGPFNCTVFYPPTTFEVPRMDVERDPLRVIYLGRICTEKRIPDLVEIIERARELSGLDLTFHLAGSLDKETFTNEVRDAVSGKPWIHLAGPVFGQEKAKFLLEGTYAVHAERDEAFGISITEYLKAGCIPVVPDEGGTPEIVDDPALTYHTNEDAARILVRLLTDESFRQEQRNRCEERAKAFSFERYMEMQHQILDTILETPK